MKMMHKMRINWPDGYDKDECIQQLVENILARFPDAEVTSAPVDTGEEIINGFNSRWIEQTFTSPMFDMATDMTIRMILNELESMSISLHDSDSPFSDAEATHISLIMSLVINHIAHKFLEEDCDDA